MANNFETEIRETYGKKYLKVFLKSLDYISNIQSSLNMLPSVAKVNITDSKSQYSLPQNLTVMPKWGFSVEEMQTEVKSELERFFSGGTNDPVFIDVTIPALGDSAYFEILDRIIQMKPQKVGDALFSSFPRRLESRNFNGLPKDWMPAFAGMTTFCEFINTFRHKFGKVSKRYKIF